MAVHQQFSRPLLIYDDDCSSCLRCARLVVFLSRGWIRALGHYHSQEALSIKRDIFPNEYDSTKMFWLINKNGAYGARAGLFEVAKEVLKVNVVRKNWNDDQQSADYDLKSCLINEGPCSSKRITLQRLFSTLKNSQTYKFSA